MHSTPFEMVKVQSQLDNLNQKRFRGSLQCAGYLIKHYGVLSLYTGSTVNIIREVVFGSVYFGSYCFFFLFLILLSRFLFFSHKNKQICLLPI
jgi:hypothetical protein